MILRSGFVKMPKCFKCKKFYANSDWNFQCSFCSKNLSAENHYVYDEPGFQEELKTWVDKRLICPHTSMCLKYACFKYRNSGEISPGILKGILNYMKKEKKYIDAKLGEELLRRTGIDSIQKSHLICPFILDWWHMRDRNFNSAEMCYYGRFRDNPAIYIKQFPPPLPFPSITKLQL